MHINIFRNRHLSEAQKSLRLGMAIFALMVLAFVAIATVAALNHVDLIEEFKSIGSNIASAHPGG